MHGLAIEPPIELFSATLKSALTSWVYGERMRLLPGEVEALGQHIEASLIAGGWLLDEFHSGQVLALPSSVLFDLAETAVYGVISFSSDADQP